jgi:hypothetical protein
MRVAASYAQYQQYLLACEPIYNKKSSKNKKRTIRCFFIILTFHIKVTNLVVLPLDLAQARVVVPRVSNHKNATFE